MYMPDQRWGILDCDNAWADAIAVWKTVDKPAMNLSFIESIANTYHVSEKSNCGALDSHDNCDSSIDCTQAVGEGSGPAGYEVWNSLVKIHQVNSSQSD